MTTNEEKLKESLETRWPVLFLGAGFSLKATSGSGCPLMVGSDLAKGLYNYVIKSQKDALAADGADTEAIEGVQSDAERGRLKEVCNFIDDYDLTDARNAFVNAKSVHGYESYQIKHAMAKNEFEWGVYLVDNNVTAADSHFETGCHDMFEIIKDPNYKNAVHYSIHTYIDMNLDYYNKKKSIPDESQWNIWKTLFESYLSCAEADTDIKKQLSHKMRAIARKYTLDFDERHYAELIK